MERKLRRTVPSEWSHIRQIRELVMEELAHLSGELQTAAAMASSELLENSIKYSDSVVPRYTVFTLVHSSREIRIATNNVVRSKACFGELNDHIGQFARSHPKDLYLRRLNEILAHEDVSGKLGLYRVAFEAGFELGCEEVGGTVTVTATRKMS